MRLADIQPRVVRLLGDERTLDGETMTDEERRKARYAATVRWRAKNRQKRNENDQRWREKKRAAA